MILQHESFETDPFVRGRELGAALHDAVANTVAAYRRLFHETHGLGPDDVARRGDAVGELLAACRPDLLQELRGIADGARVDPRTLLAINARTEILAGAGAPECSVLGVAAERMRDDRGPVLAQNWDWHPSAEGSLVLWTVRDDDGDGGWFATLTEAGILGKIGLNSRGLAVCLNILAMTEDGGPFAGLPVHAVLRLVLAECATPGDAQHLVQSERYSASSAITVASEDGELRTFEVSPHGVGVLRGQAGTICHTNHFLAGIGDAADTIARDGTGSATRLEEVSETVAVPDGVTIDAVKAVLRSHRGGASSVCCHDLDNPVYADRGQTMASVVIRPRERTIEITDGPPCGAAYVEYRPGGARPSA
ncbi:C45 family autoproteolytic acyltransferase/hydolase [Salana multivorans]